LPRITMTTGMKMNDRNYLDKLKDAYQASFPYALDNRLILQWYPKRILNRCKGGKLLELGVGHGYSSLILTPHFDQHTIVEGSMEIISAFRQNEEARNIEIVHAFFEDYVAKAPYDVIIMGFVLEHVEDPGFILMRFAEFLAPGGKIYITVPNAHALNRRLGHIAGLLKNCFTLSTADLALGHRRTFTVETLCTLVVQQGLQVEHMEGLLLKPITTAQIQTLNMSEEILQAMLQVGIDYPELSVGILAEVGRCI
jgi:2-polyprenyl-3-methyl-5-hydroxy-6-metoxy-1,4-benzoquinol methylase